MHWRMTDSSYLPSRRCLRKLCKTTTQQHKYTYTDISVMGTKSLNRKRQRHSQIEIEATKQTQNSTLQHVSQFADKFGNSQL